MYINCPKCNCILFIGNKNQLQKEISLSCSECNQKISITISDKPIVKILIDNINCPECNISIPSNLIACTNCGFPLPKYIEKDNSKTINCPECNIILPSHVNVCTNCGYPIYKNKDKLQLTNNKQKGIEYFKNKIKDSPENIELLIEYVQFLITKKNYSEAESLLKKIFELRPEEISDVLRILPNNFNLVQLLLNLNMIEPAINKSIDIYKIDKKDNAIISFLAKVSFENSDYNQVVEYLSPSYSNVKITNPKLLNYNNLFYILFSFWHLKRSDTLIDNIFNDFVQSLPSTPDKNFELFLNKYIVSLFTIIENLKQYQNSVESNIPKFLEIISKCNISQENKIKFAELYYNTAKNNFNNKKWDNAKKYCNRSIEYDNENITYRNLLKDIHHHKKRKQLKYAIITIILLFCLLILILFLINFIQRTQEENMWLRISNENNIELFKIYENKYPDGKYSKFVSGKLWEIPTNNKLHLNQFYEKYYLDNNYLYLLESEIWELALKENNLKLFEYYIIKYPEGKYSKFVEDKIWNIVTNENRIDSFEIYEKNYPNGKYINLIEDKYWIIVSKENNLKLFEYFKNKYPTSKYTNSIEDKIYEIASNSGKLDLYEYYKNEYPKGKYSNFFKNKIDELIFYDAINGHTYNKIKIGTQIWMAENLIATKFSNGDTIQNITNRDLWTSHPVGFCYSYDFPHSSVNYSKIFYNWHVVNDTKGLCPIGWHVPSKNEFQTLLDFYKNEGENPYLSLIKVGNSGFSVLLDGCRVPDGMYYKYGEGAYFWTSSEGNSYNSWAVNLYRDDKSSEIYKIEKEFGYSVRCIKNK